MGGAQGDGGTDEGSGVDDGKAIADEKEAQLRELKEELAELAES